MAVIRYRTKTPSYHQPNSLGTKTYRAGVCPFPTWSYPQQIVWPAFSNMYLEEKKESWDETHPGPPYRSGGPLFLKSRGQNITCKDRYDLIYNVWRYKGMFVISGPTDPFVALYNDYTKTANTYGAQAWNLYRPVKPSASLGQDFAEARDFAKLLKSTVKRFVDLGGLYLQVQFGWRPLLKSLLDIVKLQEKLERKLRWIRENNGKWVQRGGVVSSLNDKQVKYFNNGSTYVVNPSLATQQYVGGTVNPIREVTTTVDRVWFKARMKYYIPNLSVDKAESIWTSALLRKLYGFELTPSLCWEILPFSWLIDWFVNVGDIFSNISNQAYDNLVAKYAYVMRTRQIRRTVEWQQGVKINDGCVGLGYRQVRAASSYYVDCKERAAAGPFGFGGGMDGPFSPYQLSILLALGLTQFR